MWRFREAMTRLKAPDRYVKKRALIFPDNSANDMYVHYMSEKVSESYLLSK